MSRPLDRAGLAEIEREIEALAPHDSRLRDLCPALREAVGLLRVLRDHLNDHQALAPCDRCDVELDDADDLLRRFPAEEPAEPQGRK
jgi:hypothetical protein